MRIYENHPPPPTPLLPLPIFSVKRCRSVEEGRAPDLHEVSSHNLYLTTPKTVGFAVGSQNLLGHKKFRSLRKISTHGKLHEKSHRGRFESSGQPSQISHGLEL